MPIYQGIDISLQSQYDALTIPEFPSRPSIVTFKRSATNSALDLTLDDDLARPTFKATERVTDVNVATFRNSQLWVVYNCAAAKCLGDDEGVRYLYFKLYVAGKCVCSWGVGEKEKWKGKMLFALFDAGTDFEGKRIVEKRGLFFPKYTAGAAGDGGFEVRIFRAKGRKREPVRLEAFRDLALVDGGVRLTTTGRAKKGERQRMYSYALIDAKDEPYVAFRYRFRSDEQLRQLGVTEPHAYDRRESSVIDSEEERAETRSISPLSPTEVSFDGASEPSDDDHVAAENVRRLSVPPRKQLTPTTSQAEPSSPIKQVYEDNLFGTAELGLGDSSVLRARPREDWEVRTPSPFQADLDRIAPVGSPPSHRKTGSGGLLRSIVASALRRREEKKG